jgi:hypothetical protein
MSTRGYTAYRPKADTLHWLRCAQAVISDYRSSWPLTVRQVFYRMVAAHDFPKREADYQRLVGIIAKARRASLVSSDNAIPFEAIRDDRGTTRTPFGYEGADDFLDTLVDAAEGFTLMRSDGQPLAVELWCEAAGMVPIVEQLSRPFGLRVSSGGGYDSVTAKHKLATRAVERWNESELPTRVLHVGDFDPSGENLCDVLRDDVLMMVSQRCWADGRMRRDVFDVERVALTAQQVIDRNVITAPPKPSDARTARFARKYAWVADELGTDDISAQLEALRPDELTALLREAIETHLDRDAYDELLDREREIRDDLAERLRTWRAGE